MHVIKCKRSQRVIVHVEVKFDARDKFSISFSLQINV